MDEEAAGVATRDGDVDEEAAMMDWVLSVRLAVLNVCSKNFSHSNHHPWRMQIASLLISGFHYPKKTPRGPSKGLCDHCFIINVHTQHSSPMAPMVRITHQTT